MVLWLSTPPSSRVYTWRSHVTQWFMVLWPDRSLSRLQHPSSSWSSCPVESSSSRLPTVYTLIHLFLVVMMWPLPYHGHLHLCQFLLHLVSEWVESLGPDAFLNIVETLTCILSSLLTGEHECDLPKMLQMLMENHPVLACWIETRKK